MNKRILLSAMIYFVCFFIVKGQTYVQITNCNNSVSTYDFKVNNVYYKPLVCNYNTEIYQDPNTSQYYIGPHHDYVSGGNYDPSNSASAVTRAKNKLWTDLARIQSLGFTEIRIGAGLLDNGFGVFSYPAGGQTGYFNLMDAFFAKMQTDNPGLRVILLMDPGHAYYPNTSNFKPILGDVAYHFRNTTNIMAYDLINEPDLHLLGDANAALSQNDKYNIAKVFNEWNNVIKKNDQNHLTTIGIWYTDVYAYDPLLSSVDFVSYHPYPDESEYNSPANYSGTNKIISTQMYWLSKTMTKPWIIGETGWTGTNYPYSGQPNLGNQSYPEANQSDYAAYTLQRSLDCNCKGYSWWKYQETFWGPAYGGAMQDYLGLYYQYSPTGPIEGAAKLIAHPVSSPFKTYAGMTQNSANCTKPSNYYTISNGTVSKKTGYVKDNNNVPIANALIKGQDTTYTGGFSTYSDANGYFDLKTSGLKLGTIRISYPGYSSIFEWGTSTTTNFILQKTSNNMWAKQWSNSNFGNKLGSNWTFSASDKFYKGDFNGDGKQDVLCVQYTNGSTTTDHMAILTYTQTFTQSGNNYHTTADWALIWDNQSNSANGGGIYAYRNNLVVGDFNGDGKDDVISIGGWTTWFTFSPNSNPTAATWNWIDSNYGNINNPSYPMSYMASFSNNVIAGDFYGAGRSAIMGSGSNGWLTSFQIVNGAWAWIQSNNGLTNNSGAGNELSYLTPYITQLIPGNFDGSDSRIEILGNALPSGAMAMFKPKWNGSAWKWINSSNQPYWIDAGNTSGMYAYRNNLVAGNFDGDNNDEVQGFNSSFSVTFKFGSWTSTNCSFAWDGGYYSTISDWNISPSAYKYLFIKTDANAPNGRQELLAIRNNSGSWQAGLYSFRLNPESVTPCSTLRLATTGNNENAGIEENINGDEIKVYPNPNQGKFTITFPNSVKKETLKINVYDVQGKEIPFIFDSEVSDNSIDINVTNVKTGLYYMKIKDNNNSYAKKIIIQ